MDKLLNFLEKLLLSALSWLLLYKKGKNDAHNEKIEQTNKALAAGLKAACDGDYSADAVRKRMQDDGSGR